MPRRSYRKKSFRRKRKSFMRRRVGLGTNKAGMHYFKRSYFTAFNTYDWPVIHNQGWDFFLSQLPNYTEFTNLYDQYKISRIKVKFIYTANSQNVTTAAAITALPNLLTVIDNNDSAALSTSGDYCQYRSFKIRRLDKPCSVYFKPQFDIAAYSGAFTSYAQKTGWIDSNSPNVKHYGLKFAVDPMFYGAGANVTGRIQCILTYYIKCRHPK